MPIKFSQFLVGGTQVASDIDVGLRNGTNYQFDASTGGSGTITAIDGTVDQITAVTVSGVTTLSIPTTFIAPGTLSAVTSVSAPQYLLTGSTSGSISLLSQANAGTYNFNLPITAGASGSVLTSAGGGSAPMTWTALSSLGVSSIAGTGNQISASASTGAVTLSIPSTFIAPGTIAAVTSVSSPEYLLTGSSSGTISILGQSVAGTYNFNLPITAGTSGYLLTSGGGSTSPMTWTNPASIGGVTTVTGTSNQVTASPTSGAVVLTIPTTFIAPGTIQATTSVSGLSFILAGSSSGAVTIQPQAAAGTYNFNVPTTAGTAGYALVSGGGGSSPMTWAQIVNQAASVTKLITQAAHGFSVGNVVYLNSSTYALAEANNVGTAEVIGIVSSVVDVNDFILLVEGYITGLSGLTAGTVYFLSDGTAGLLTATQPTTVGNVSMPLLVADSTTSGYFHRYRGKIIPTAISYPLTVPNGGTGDTSFTAYQPVVGGTSTTSALQSVSTTNAINGATLAYQGTGAIPAYSVIPGVNLLINGDFQIMQRFNSPISQAASTTSYTWDRWQLATNANQATTCTTETSANNNTNQARIQRNSGQTGTGTYAFCQSVTVNNSRNAANNYITLSFNALCGANFSPTSNDITVTVYSGTGTNKSGINGAFTGSATPISTTQALTTTTTAYTFTSASTVGASVTQLCVQFSWTPTGTAGANDWVQFGDLQLEVNTVASPFQRLLYEESLLNCQAYYIKTFNQGVAPAQNTGSNFGALSYYVQIAGTAAGYEVNWQFPTTMIASPVGHITYYSPSSASATWYNGSISANSGTPANNTVGLRGIGVANPQVSGDVATNQCIVHAAIDVDLT